MVDAVGRFTRAMKEGGRPRWLSLLGSSGAGKTFLARRVWRWFQTSELWQTRIIDNDCGRPEAQYPGHWCYWPKLGGLLASNEGYDALRELAMDRFVVFDEIGADRDPSGHIRDCLARTLSSRVDKWTIITSNKSLQQVGDDIDPRIASRMIRDGSETVVIEVPDYSIKKIRSAT
jgi:DNA replication protein DnaC